MEQGRGKATLRAETARFTRSTVSPDDHALTALFQAARAGDDAAVDRALPLVYDELRDLAAWLLRREGPGHTLQATALVHEAWLKISKAAEASGAGFEGRSHFLGVASKAMRHVLVSHARSRGAQKRGGDAERVPLDDCVDSVQSDTGDLIAFDEALRRLAEVSPRQARVVELKVFGDLSFPEIAESLGVGLTTAKADWRFARAWLHKVLEAID